MGIPKKSQGNSRSETVAPIFPQAKSVKDLVAWLEIGDSLRTINPHSCHTHLLWSTIQPQTNVRYPLLMRNYHCDLIFSQLKYFLCFGVFYINWGKNSYKIGQRGYSDLNPHWLWSPRTCTNLLLEGMYGPFLLFQFPVAYSHTDLGVTRSGWDRLIPSTSTEYELIISPQFSHNPPSLLPSRSSEPWTDSPIHPDMSNHPQLPPPSHPPPHPATPGRHRQVWPVTGLSVRYVTCQSPRQPQGLRTEPSLNGVINAIGIRSSFTNNREVLHSQPQILHLYEESLKGYRKQAVSYYIGWPTATWSLKKWSDKGKQGTERVQGHVKLWIHMFIS